MAISFPGFEQLLSSNGGDMKILPRPKDLKRDKPERHEQLKARRNLVAPVRADHIRRPARKMLRASNENQRALKAPALPKGQCEFHLCGRLALIAFYAANFAAECIVARRLIIMFSVGTGPRPERTARSSTDNRLPWRGVRVYRTSQKARL
jgi:hypothetical protein